MGRIFLVELHGHFYRCKSCDTHLSLADDLLSQTFRSQNGRAYLFENVVNVSVGPNEDRAMISGIHTVADVFCCGCGQLLGWKYIIARDKNGNYKEGKVVLERCRIIKDFDGEERPRDSDFQQIVVQRFAPIYGVTPEERVEHLLAFMQDIEPLIRQFQQELPEVVPQGGRG